MGSRVEREAAPGNTTAPRRGMRRRRMGQMNTVVHGRQSDKTGGVGEGLARPARLRGVRLGTWATPYLFLLPALVLYCVFLVYPMLDSFAISLTSWDGLSPTRPFVGLANYQRIFQDPVAITAFENNLI